LQGKTLTAIGAIVLENRSLLLTDECGRFGKQCLVFNGRIINMLGYLKEEANIAFTENGAVTRATTGSDCLDFFACAGALRHAGDDEIIKRFMRAYTEDPDLAMKILFYGRDVRGGMGERRMFRVILKFLSEDHTESVEKNIVNIPEYGRFDDLLVLAGTKCEDAVFDYIRKQLDEDIKAMADGDGVSLLAKWMPSINTSSRQTVRTAKYVAGKLGMKDADYRRILVRLRGHIKIIENSLRESDYSFDYSKQPSKAMFKYREAFERNDSKRYGEFLSAVSAGEQQLHTGTLMPYEIIAPLFDHEYGDDGICLKGIGENERRSIDTTWNMQKNYAGDENALAVIDGSGSMYMGRDPIPAAVAQSLGIYFAERSRGVFKNHFITFSETPRLVEIKGRDIFEKVCYCSSYNEIANTNIQKVFELILDTAVRNRVPQQEMPSRLYMISDMEFDCCVMDSKHTNFDCAKHMFNDNGYQLPELIFWNVDSRNRQQPVTENEQGTVLVSGCSPRIFSMLAEGTISPYAYMMDIMGSERYACIAA
jgi:hypothetical protein